MNFINVTINPGIGRTEQPLDPAVEAWRAEVERLMNAEYELRYRNLMLYGTTHPEAMQPGLVRPLSTWEQMAREVVNPVKFFPVNLNSEGAENDPST